MDQINANNKKKLCHGQLILDLQHRIEGLRLVLRNTERKCKDRNKPAHNWGGIMKTLHPDITYYDVEDYIHFLTEVVRGLECSEHNIDQEPERIQIARDELIKLTVTNSPDIPHVVNDGGIRKRWVGIGWVPEGEARGTEVEVID